MCEVMYLIKATGALVTRTFDSPYLARKLVNKLRRSKKCELVWYSNNID